MNYIYKWFKNNSEITIISAKPQELNTSQDLLCIILDQYPDVNPYQIFVSNPHEGFARVVGDNINVSGTVKVFIKSKEIKKKEIEKNA